MGGSPVIVLDDADLDTAVDAALYGCFLHSGQVCESGTRLLLPGSVHDEFVDRLVARTAQIKVGDPSDFDTDVGPVVSREQRDRILGYILSGEEEGGKVVFGGGVPQGEQFQQGYWVEPTIFVDVTNDMKIARERSSARCCRSSATKTPTRPSASPTTRRTAWPRRCGAPMTSAP